MGWLALAYLGSLAALLLTALYSVDDFTSEVVKDHLTTSNLHELVSNDLYRTVMLRSLAIAAAVTVIDLVIAVPVGFYMAKLAKPKARSLLVVGLLMPLWASYLVKAYVWRAILDPEGGLFKRVLGGSPGFGLAGVVIVLAYLWLPYMILPVYTGFERLPNSLLEASADLGGRAGVTFRKVLLPLVVPSLAAGSIFTFSLSLGDYIAAGLVGGKVQVLGNLIYRTYGRPNYPLASAIALIPVGIMVIYLLAVRRSGALENL
ncbi:MAG: ABC transporter permease [Acidimicrobiales bacterium]